MVGRLLIYLIEARNSSAQVTEGNEIMKTRFFVVIFNKKAAADIVAQVHVLTEFAK